MLINNRDLDIDVLDELSDFTFVNSKIKGDEMVCCSPFRDEKSPSFSINLETGLWIDFGADSLHSHKGNLISLLAHLKEVSYEEVVTELLERYGVAAYSDIDDLTLDINLKPIKEETVFNPTYKPSYSHYLSRRGVSDMAQIIFTTGESKHAISLVWRDIKGNIINIKHRQIDTKTFYYEKGGKPIKNHLYGLYECLEWCDTTGVPRDKVNVFICESEIDALTLWSNGQLAIATGGSSLSVSQKKILLNSGIRSIVIATDNDKVGSRFREFLIQEFVGLLEVSEYVFPKGIKDINELSKKELLSINANIRSCGLSW